MQRTAELMPQSPALKAAAERRHVTTLLPQVCVHVGGWEHTCLLAASPIGYTATDTCDSIINPHPGLWM
jgi:hypothetical protein